MRLFIFSCLLLALPMLLCAHTNGKVKTYTLQEALAQEKAELLSATYIGDKRIRLKVKNPHKRKDIKIRFETGLQFASRDTSEQDQIILQARTLLVRAGATVTPSFASYCTQAKHLSPDEDSPYDIKKEANGKLLELCQFLSNEEEVDYIAQHAVWTVTNDHDLKGLWHQDTKTAIKIQNFVAKLTGKPLPKYTVRYKDGRERQVAFSAEAVIITARHQYDLEADATMTCKIYNEEGEMVQAVFENMPQKKGHHTFSFHLKALDLPAGKYVSKVFEGDNVFQEIWVET